MTELVLAIGPALVSFQFCDWIIAVPQVRSRFYWRLTKQIHTNFF